MTELQILNAVKNSGGSIGFVELLNMGKTDSSLDSFADKRLIEKLIESEVLSGRTEAYALITFGKDGHLRLRDLQQSANDLADHMAYEQSEKHADKRFQTSQTILGIVIGSLFTLLIEIVINSFFG